MSDKVTNPGIIDAHRSGIFGMRTMRRAVAYVIVVSLAIFAASTPVVRAERQNG
jgi:hypothetical protein